jgi:hypothetical protein
VNFLTEVPMSDTAFIKPASTQSFTWPLKPRFGKIPAAAAYSGLGRTRLYEIAAENPGLFRKSGKSTLVDFEYLDQVLNRLPAAAIKPRSSGRDA